MQPYASGNSVYSGFKIADKKNKDKSFQAVGVFV